ncbi:MAG TPA: ferritin-like domain-containing protein [Acidimicrobiales bacterium]|jgi:bacterioferritin (cytochrome b1)|nr:ferritin-like domain-containing protein [Acidimicrobiales bacterium]
MSEEMEVDEALALLGDVLSLQYRSTLQFTLAAGSIGGLAYTGLVERFWQYAVAELADTRRLVEKIVALGGTPVPDVAPLAVETEAPRAVRGLVEAEEEVIAALQKVIPKSGEEPRSEALEHFVEHLMSRKQEQVDQLLRALGETE